MLTLTGPPAPAYSARFLACLPFTLAQECPHPADWSNPRNFSDDAHDPGGKTMCGIIQREYDAWRKAHGLPVRDVRKLAQDEGYAIYYANYWHPHADDLPPGLDLDYFDAAVNEGAMEANRILQFALGVPADGTWGPQTAAAVAGIHDRHAAVVAFTTRREAVYRAFRGFQYFGKDWERRSAEIGAQALQMAAS
ncbi:MAG TPA: glycosyl hydrolase 108 family protein [Xanthobacteraceae bacterium]|nr:glycosyl hydrolase 108 family protein [Xanthobacteraceae bacterium]